MANIPNVKYRQNDTNGIAPSASDLNLGDLAFNIADGSIYYKDGSDVVYELATLNLNTNAFTDAEQSKLAGIESGAQVNVGDEFNSSGTYSSLRAQATTQDDVGLSNVRNVGSYSQEESDSKYSTKEHSMLMMFL